MNNNKLWAKMLNMHANSIQFSRWPYLSMKIPIRGGKDETTINMMLIYAPATISFSANVSLESISLFK